MNKWKLFHKLQKLPLMLRNAHYKGWRGFEYRKEETGTRIQECGCTYEWKQEEGWYGYPPSTQKLIRYKVKVEEGYE